MHKTIAIFGDVHGHQDAMVTEVLRWQEEHQARIDLILCVGDFQTLRGEIDMHAMACPAKHQQIGDYPPYHDGQKSFPAEVVFIGGNHEAYNWLETMPTGGCLDPQCYYMGRWGVTERLGLRIGGLTGNYSPRAYESGRNPVDYDPAAPASERSKKQSTYFTSPEVEALAKQGPLDILLLHDWPAGLPELVEPSTTDGTPRPGRRQSARTMAVGATQAPLGLLRPHAPVLSGRHCLAGWSANDRRLPWARHRHVWSLNACSGCIGNRPGTVNWMQSRHGLPGARERVGDRRRECGCLTTQDSDKIPIKG